MKGFYLLCLLILSCNGMLAQEAFAHSSENNAQDHWSGRYRLEIKNGDSVIDQLPIYVVIRQIEDIHPEDVTYKYRSDLKRWVIMTEGTDDEVIIRRFLFDHEEEENGYEEFGWTKLHEDGKMECIDAGHFFICKTTPNTTVNFGDDETAFTESGIFGIRLHLGLFELYSVEE